MHDEFSRKDRGLFGPTAKNGGGCGSSWPNPSDNAKLAETIRLSKHNLTGQY